jgi:hypothetical protein
VTVAPTRDGRIWHLTLRDTARKAALSSEADTSVQAARTGTASSSKSVMFPRFGGNLDQQDPVPRFVLVGPPSNSSSHQGVRGCVLV